ncbi:beta-propeller fold lactonase family protein [Pseudonocardia sp.]|uniref:beta-propeller fold lactonase family protein n=1 Tax=Pseudonocardia sp. TaxID=60912 RepID=UPI003D0EEE86
MLIFDDTTARPAGVTRPGRTFGHYRLQALLGRGRTGEVYRAFDTRRERPVALKLLFEHLAADAGYRERFEREVERAATLLEPHIIPVHDFGEIDGRLYVDMRLVDGVDLAALLRLGPLAPARAVDVVSQLADALDAAHAAGLVHGAVSPSDVLLAGPADRAAHRGFAYLVDLGVTSALGGPATGCPAPEVRRGAHPDRRSDVHALACLMHTCLAGPGGTAAQVPPPLRGVIARGLAEDPAQRPASAGRLAAAARAVLADVHEEATTAVIPLRPLSAVAQLPGEATTSLSGAGAPTAAAPAGPPGPPGAPAPAPPSRRRRGRWMAALLAAAAAVATAAAVLTPLLDPPLAETARTRVGLTPADVVVSPDGRRAYVANLGDDTVSVLDATTLAPVGTPIAVGDAPNSLALSADGRRLYVSDTRADTVTIVDTAAARAVATVAVGAFPDGIALSPDGRRLYVGNAEDDTVSVIDTATEAVVGRPIPVGRRPYGLALAPDGATLYVSAFDSDELTAVDTARNAAAWTVAVGDGPLNLAVARDGSRVYVANTLDGSVSVVDPASRTAVGAPVPVGPKPIGITLGPTPGTVYVAERDADAVVVVDTAARAVGDPVEPGKGPVAMWAAGGQLYVVSEISGELTVLATGGT